MSLVTPPPAPATPHRSTLALRIVAVIVLVALLFAVIALGIAVNAVQRTAREANGALLSQQADLVAADASGAGPARPGAGGVGSSVAVLLDQRDIALVHIRDGIGTLAAGSAVPAAVAIAEQAGVLAPGAAMPASGSVTYRDVLYLVEARALPSGAAFALVSRADEGAVTSRVLFRRVLIALLIALGVAIPIGLILARVVSTPLRRTTEVATAMSSGRRDLRVPVGGPAEVREVAASVNRLADDLAASEARQQRFIASVSHELRTPLAAVAGLSDALADGMVAPDEVAQVGGTIRREAARLERLVTDLLDLARVGSDQFSLDLGPVDVGELLAELDRDWRVRCEQRQVPLTVAAPPGLRVWADPRRLRQVVDGLTDNALRQLPAGRPLVVEATATDGRATIQVRDGGPGLAAEDYPLAFQPGVLHEKYRRARPGGGGGLGLALAAGLVARMGGSIAAGPAPEGGLAVLITLAVAP